MSDRRYRQVSLRGPVILLAVVLLLMLTLTVLWNVALVHDYQELRAFAIERSGAFHWTFIALGSGLFLTIIVLSSVLGAQLFSHIRWRQRQSHFIASVSHELNSPLSSIKLFAQTLRRAELSREDRTRFVDKLLFDVERLARLISNILRAAEVDNRGDVLQVALQRVELHGYLAEYVRDAAALNESEGLGLSLAGEPGLWVGLDRMIFRQVLDNLIDNAIRYRGEGPPRVEIRLAPRGEWVDLRISDRGVGIPPADLPKVFERFYRAEQPDGERGRRGTGIGLYVVRSIVVAHGGRVGATSGGRGTGTTVWIRLPRVEAEARAA